MTLVNVSKRSATLFNLSLAFIFLLIFEWFVTIRSKTVLLYLQGDHCTGSYATSTRYSVRLSTLFSASQRHS